MKTNVKFRHGLPLGHLNHFGLIHSINKLSVKKRAKFRMECHRLLDELLHKSVPEVMDNGVDVMAQKFMQDALPPTLTNEEQYTTVHEQGERWSSTLNRVTNVVELEPDTRVLLLRRHCLRVIEQEEEDDSEDDLVAFYSTDNARSYHDRPPSTLGVDKETLPALEMLFSAYPEYTSIESLPLATIEDKITFVATLYEKGLVRTEWELEHSDDEESEDSDDEEDALPSNRGVKRKKTTDDDDDDEKSTDDD